MQPRTPFKLIRARKHPGWLAGRSHRPVKPTITQLTAHILKLNAMPKPRPSGQTREWPKPRLLTAIAKPKFKIQTRYPTAMAAMAMAMA
ncbi:hypothetical protein Pint_15009 [Pistacia integerrima]|uniref:Uncharacterized protein n=1 Tax=Pistacia integerrima TaxID=434235 RepID=A0ACC0ZFB3_9ROSI|nr:hypothetical protein Pint_15009 [Pistacia integerrima]